jgi:uncharacterized protein YecE (DUF72 family)
VKVSAFVGGVRNSKEIIHVRNLVGAEAEAERLPQDFRYAVEVRHRSWLGDRREFPEGHTHLKKDRDDELSWWSDLVDRFLGEGRTVFAYANNHYQNHSPSTLRRFMEIRRGEF